MCSSDKTTLIFQLASTACSALWSVFKFLSKKSIFFLSLAPLILLVFSKFKFHDSKKRHLLLQYILNFVQLKQNCAFWGFKSVGLFSLKIKNDYCEATAVEAELQTQIFCPFITANRHRHLKKISPPPSLSQQVTEGWKSLRQKKRIVVRAFQQKICRMIIEVF